MKVDIGHVRLEEHLNSQLGFLERSCKSYDEGFEDEIARMAVTVRVLLHDTGRSESLIKLLNLKGGDFHDGSYPYDERNMCGHSSLVLNMSTDGRSVPIPMLDSGPFKRVEKFDVWWDGIVFVDKNRNEFSRKDIVNTLANKEGGAHVDKKLDEDYYNLRKENSLGWLQSDSEGRLVPPADQVPASMRQIAHEVLKTFKQNYECKFEVPKNAMVHSSISLIKGSEGFPGLRDRNLVKSRPFVDGVKIGRNDPCHCGSGIKFKKCCIYR